MHARLSALLAVCMLVLLPGAVFAADVRPAEVIIIGSNETVSDDLYAFGRSVEVLGTVRGDVIAGAATVTIAGTVTGDVMAVAGQVNVQGDVNGSVRVSGGNVTIDGRVGEDVLAGSGNLIIGPRATVGRDVYAGTGTATISGRVGRNVKAGAGDLTISAPVGGDVDADVGRLRLSQGASISGQLRYTSENDADIAPGTTIQGGVQHQVRQRREEPPANPAFDTFISWIRAVVGLFMLGLLLELLAPGIGERTMVAVTRSPGASILWGTILLLLVPVAAVAVFVLGLLVGGWWIGLILLAAYAIALICSVALAGMAIGRWLFERIGRSGVHFAWALLVGVAILALVGLVPVAGGLLVGVIVLVAFGGLVLSTFRRPAREGVVAAEAPPAVLPPPMVPPPSPA